MIPISNKVLAKVWRNLFFKFYLCVYFCLHGVFIAAHGSSMVATSGGYSLVEVRGLLIAMPSFVAEHRL